MMHFAYFKAEPTEYILAYSNGRIFRQGAGRSFWYWRPSTSIVLVPLATIDALFVLNETTGNFQAVTLQGQITYRIAEPTHARRAAELHDRAAHAPVSLGGPGQAQPAHRQHRAGICARRAAPACAGGGAARRRPPGADGAERAFRRSAAWRRWASSCTSLFFTAIRPTPEMAKALEAEYREALQKRADQAIYSRRADAVEQERKIKQNELSTAVDLEQRRQELVDLQSENARKQAESEAATARITLAPYQDLDTRLMLALAFRDFAANADKIGNLTITSEILEQLLNAKVSDSYYSHCCGVFARRGENSRNIKRKVPCCRRYKAR